MTAALSQSSWRARFRVAGPVALVVGGLVLSTSAAPADMKAPDPAAQTDPVPGLFVDPGAILTALADHLDQDPDHVVLQVATQSITQDDVANVVRTMPANMGNLASMDIYRRALDVLARQKAMVAHAKQEHLDQDPLLIHEGQIAFERIISDAWLKRQADAAVTEEALRARYEHDFANSPGPQEVRARVILLPTETEAQAVIQELQGGADFVQLARQRSKDSSAAHGGDLGYVTRDNTTPELAAVMFSLAPGQVTAYPVATLMGYFVIRIDGRRNREPLTFEQARPRLTRELRGEAIQAAISGLLSNVRVIQIDAK